MAAPYYIQASTGTTDSAGAWTHTANAPRAAGNVYLIQVLADGTNASAPAIDSVTNAENLAGTDNTVTQIGTFDIGSAAVARQRIYIARALNTSAMVITGSNVGGDDVYVRVYEFASVNTGTTLATVIENSTAGSTANSAGTSGTISDAGVVTLGPDRLALNFVGINDDNAVAAFTGMTGGIWVEAVAEYADATGTDACIQLQFSYLGILNWSAGGASVSVQGDGGATSERQAQSFASGAGGTIYSVSFITAKAASPTDNLLIEIQADSGGSPSGTALATATIAGTSMVTGAGPWTADFASSVTLSASTTYWIVWRRDGSRDTTNYYNVYNTGSNSYASGSPKERQSGSWATPTTNDTIFALDYGSTTVDGGTTSNPDATDGWGAAGFALIGTTVVDTGPQTSLPNVIFERYTPRRRVLNRM